MLGENVKSHVEYSPVYRPTIEVFAKPEEVDMFAARMVIEQIQKKPDSVLVLPTGLTPIGMYRLLVDAYKAGQVDFSKVTILNLDEYWPIDPNNPASYAQFMKQHFFDHVNVPASNRHIANGKALDPHQEAERYEALLKQFGPPDLAILGIGPGETCHIGFNERGSLVDSRVRYVTLDKETAQVNSQYFGKGEQIPEGALTQGVGNILEAKTVLLLAKGPGKAWGVQRSLEGPIGPDAPASFVRLHKNTILALDHDAASLCATLMI